MSKYVLYTPPESSVTPLPGVQSLIDPSLDLTELGDMVVMLEVNRLKDNEPLRVPAALPDSCEFRGQRLDKAAPDYPAWRVIPPRKHCRQGSPAGLPRLVVLDPPLRCAPSLQCTQSPYTSLMLRSSPVGTYPGRSPAGLSLSTVSSILSPVDVDVVIASAYRSGFCVASGDSDVDLCAAAAGPIPL